MRRPADRRQLEGLRAWLGAALGLACATAAAAEGLPGGAVKTLAIPFEAQGAVVTAAGFQALAEARAGVDPLCFWMVAAMPSARAQAIRVALIELDVDPDRILIDVRPGSDNPAAGLYCSLPEPFAVSFAPGTAALSADALARLELVAPFLRQAAGDFLIRGFADTAETADPVALAFARAQALRARLMAAGIEARRLALEGETRRAPRPPRAEIERR